ncbi:hypothetical protein CsSME_00002232 [Camellia sinensis var. sinensis]
MAPAAAAADLMKEEEEWCSSSSSSHLKRVVCVMDASGPLGSNLVQRLLQIGYTVHATATTTTSTHSHSHFQCVDEEDEEDQGLSSSSSSSSSSCDEKENRLRVFHSDPLDYHSILTALKGCSGLFYCFEPPSDHPSYDEFLAEVEVRAAHNVLEACAQTDAMEKVVFTSSATAIIWRDGRNTAPDIDERNWSDINFCKKYKLWHGASKTLAEKTAWGLAMDRGVNMVSVNGGMLIGPPALMNINNPYLKGAAEMYEDGVFVTVDLRFLVDAHICVFEDVSSYGRYLCFNKVINSNIAALKLAHMLSPPAHQTHSLEDTRVYQQRISNKKLEKLMVDTDLESDTTKLFDLQTAVH